MAASSTLLRAPGAAARAPRPAGLRCAEVTRGPAPVAALSTRLPATHEAASKAALDQLKASPSTTNREF